MRKFIFRQSIKMMMLCLIYVASCKTTDNQTTVSPPTKESFIGTAFKSDLDLIDRAFTEVESLRYQLPRNKGKDLNQLSFQDVEETLLTRIAQDKGEDILAIYAELKKEPVYQELMAAQAKSLSIIEKGFASARAITAYDMKAILSPFDELLNKTDVSKKYLSYCKALQESLSVTLSSHIQEMEKAKEVVDGEEVIKNYDKSALQNAFHSKISVIENEILTDNGLTDDEKTILLQTTTMTYERSNLIASILNDEGTATEGGRVQWSWRKFFRVAAIVVAVVAVAVVAAYVAPIIAPKVFAVVAKIAPKYAAKYVAGQTAITVKALLAKNAVITAGGIMTAGISSVLAGPVASRFYCNVTGCDRCNPYFVILTIKSCL